MDSPVVLDNATKFGRGNFNGDFPVSPRIIILFLLSNTLLYLPIIITYI